MTSTATCVAESFMHAISKIIERNLYRISSIGLGLWINPEKDDGWAKAARVCPQLKLFSQDSGAFNFLQQRGADVQFSAFPQGDTKYDWIVLNLPRQKDLLRMMLDCVASLLSTDGFLWLAGENRAGIKSADKLLKLYFSEVRKLDNARHCTLFEAGKARERRVFDPLPYRQEWPLECGPSRIRVMSYPGVFAHGRLDDGTALLLDALANIPVEGQVLDFACGAGVIGACVAASHEHAQVTLLDNSALALLASGETLAVNRLEGTLLASDGLSELTGRFDLVVSNPPVHAGVKTDNRLSTRLLESVSRHINPGGMLIMVANRHLPYEKWLSRELTQCRQLAANDRYKVILAKK